MLTMVPSLEAMQLLVASLVLLAGTSTQVSAQSWEYVPRISGYAFLPRSSFGSASANNATAVLFGGAKETDFGNAVYYNDLATLEYNAMDDSYAFAQIPVVQGSLKPSPRAHAGFAVTNDYMLVVGGTTPNTTAGAAAGSTEIASDVSWLFHRSNYTWTEVTANGPSKRTLATVVRPSAEANKFYVFSGVNEQPALTNDAVLNDYWEFDADTGSWTQFTTGRTSGRYDARGAMEGDLSYFYGGYAEAVGSGGSTNLLSSTTRFRLDDEPGEVTALVFDSGTAPERWLAGFTAVTADTFLLTGGSQEQGANKVCGNPPTPLAGATETFLFNRSSILWFQVGAGGGHHGGVMDMGVVIVGPHVLVVGGYRYDCNPSAASGQEGAGQVYETSGVYRMTIQAVLEAAAKGPDTSGNTASTPAPGPAGPGGSTSAAGFLPLVKIHHAMGLLVAAVVGLCSVFI